MGHRQRALTVARLLYYGNNSSAQHGVEALKSLLSALPLPLIPPKKRKREQNVVVQHFLALSLVVQSVLKRSLSLYSSRKNVCGLL